MDLPLKKKNANGSLEVHNDGITVTSRIIAQEKGAFAKLHYI